MTDSNVPRPTPEGAPLDATAAILVALDDLAGALKGYVRSPNAQYAYSRCVACDAPWWDDKERHNIGCPLLGWRDAFETLRRWASRVAPEGGERRAGWQTLVEAAQEVVEHAESSGECSECYAEVCRNAAHMDGCRIGALKQAAGGASNHVLLRAGSVAEAALDAILAKCEQYWNEFHVGDEEVHVSLEFIHWKARVVRAALAVAIERTDVERAIAIISDKHVGVSAKYAAEVAARLRAALASGPGSPPERSTT